MDKKSPTGTAGSDAVGREIWQLAAGLFLGTRAPISSYRGRWQKARGHDVLPTFHPAYLLRNPAAKAQSWADLRQLRRALDRPAPSL